MSRPKRNFAPMPLAVLASTATPQEKLFVLAIYHHDWDGVKAWPSMDRIARITGFKARTMRDTRACLEARGWLVVDPRKGRSNNYSLNIPDMTFDEFEQVMNGGTPAPHAGVAESTPAPHAGAPAPHAAPLRTENHKPEPISINTLISKNAAAIMDAFKAVWNQQHPGEIFIKGPSDEKQAKGLAAQGVAPELVTAKAEAWMQKADAYTRERNHPFWLFVRSFMSIKTTPSRRDDDGPGEPSL